MRAQRRMLEEMGAAPPKKKAKRARPTAPAAPSAATDVLTTKAVMGSLEPEAVRRRQKETAERNLAKNTDILRQLSTKRAKKARL